MTRSIFTRWLFCTVPIYLYIHMLCVGMIIALRVELYNSIDFSSNKMVPPTRLHLYSSSRTKICTTTTTEKNIVWKWMRNQKSKWSKGREINSLKMHLNGDKLLIGFCLDIRSFLFREIFLAHTRPTMGKKNNRPMNDDDGWIQHRMNVVRTKWKTPIWWISIYPADWLISSEPNSCVVSLFYSTFRFENYFLHKFFAHEWIKRVERRGTHSEQLLIGHHFCLTT